MRTIVALLTMSFCLPSDLSSAGEMPRPLIELLFSNDVQNTGTLESEARLVEFAPGEGARFGPGVRGMGLDLSRSSRSGGSDRSAAGGAAAVGGRGLHGLQQMTLTLWFAPRSSAGPARLLYYSPSWDLYIANGTVGFKTRTNGKDVQHYTPSDQGRLVENQWNFLAITLDETAGEARCYHGLHGGSLQHICTWKDVPKLDRGDAELLIGNLGGIRPFQGLMDSVRIFGQLLDAGQIQDIFAADAQPHLTLRQRAAQIPSRSPLFAYGDVCLSSRSIRPHSIETIETFRANRLTWAYSTDSQFIEQCKQAGAKTYQAAINSLPGHDNAEAHCLDLDGKPMVAPWMVAFNREQPVYWGCNNRTRFMETCLERAGRALASGADWIQFDDWSLIVSAARWGGACFCDDCMAGFARYLKTHLSDEERSKLDLDDLKHFDYRRYLAEHDDVGDAASYKTRYRSLPLTPYFQDFQYRSVRSFFAELRRRINAEAGRQVPLSINSSFLRPDQRSNYLVDLVDFLQGETWHFDLSRLTIACKTAEGLGKWQVFVPKPQDEHEMRMGIALTYAMGQIMLVPWDMYMGSDATGIRPRYYGTVEQYGDLYHFIRDHAALLNDQISPAFAGVVVDLDHYDSRRVARICQKLLDAQMPFTLMPVGHSFYDCRLDADRLTACDLVLVAANSEDLAEPDRNVLQSAAEQTVVVPDHQASADLLAAASPLTVWGPPGIYLLPRVKLESGDRTLVCHVLNRVRSDAVQDLHWVSFLVRRKAFLGNRLARVRWYTPGHDALDLEFETLPDGARVIVPRLPIWGIAELTFEQQTDSSVPSEGNKQ